MNDIFILIDIKENFGVFFFGRFWVIVIMEVDENNVFIVVVKDN